MNIATTIFAVLIALLSVAAGAAKIMLVPEEAEFLAQFGFADLFTITFGLAQVIGGVLIMIPSLRLYGSSICTVLFAVSFGMILAIGNLMLARLSLLPILISCFIIFQSLRAPTPIIKADT